MYPIFSSPHHLLSKILSWPSQMLWFDRCLSFCGYLSLILRILTIRLNGVGDEAERDGTTSQEAEALLQFCDIWEYVAG